MKIFRKSAKSGYDCSLKFTNQKMSHPTCMSLHIISQRNRILMATSIFILNRVWKKLMTLLLLGSLEPLITRTQQQHYSRFWPHRTELSILHLNVTETNSFLLHVVFVPKRSQQCSCCKYCIFTLSSGCAHHFPVSYENSKDYFSVIKEVFLQ